jgi:hypothetical protein
MRFTAPDATPDALLGVHVGLSGGVVLVRAQLADRSGACYVLQRTGGEWRYQAKVTASDGESNDFFGLMSLDGMTALIGSTHDDDRAVDAGAVYVFDLSDFLACRSDFDGNGQVDIRDVAAFLNAWASGDLAGDFDENGWVDTRDFIAFLNAWSSGC